MDTYDLVFQWPAVTCLNLAQANIDADFPSGKIPQNTWPTSDFPIQLLNDIVAAILRSMVLPEKPSDVSVYPIPVSNLSNGKVKNKKFNVTKKT